MNVIADNYGSDQATRRSRRQRLWKRQEVSSCHCELLSYRHVHCPCLQCLGKAVAMSVERRHWNNMKTMLDRESSQASASKHQANHVANEFVSCNDETELMEVENDQGNVFTHSNQGDFLDEDGNKNVDDDHADNDENFAHSHEEDSSDDNDGDCNVEAGDDNVDNDDDSNGGGGDDDDDDEIADKRPERIMMKAVMEAFSINDSMNGSHESFVKILNYGKNLHKSGGKDTSIWPQSYFKALKFLEEIGYVAPTYKKACLSNNHITRTFNYDPSILACTSCTEAPNIPIYYNNISNKVKLWCSNKNMCFKMLAHWREKDHWLHRLNQEPFFPIKEMWDGTRFAEMSWFWNPDAEWILPEKCPGCKEVTAASNMSATNPVTCNNCGEEFVPMLKKVKGDPRNIALMLHWDGFQPFGEKGKHSCGAIEASILNMEKADRNNVAEVYVLTFVPVHLLPKQRPNLLDPYIEMIVAEVEELFIKGIQVNYALDCDDYPAGTATIRCCVLACTGDYPAQCEMGKSINGGIMACRRDKLKGVRINPKSSTYYYTDNRKHNRYPWEIRDYAADEEMIDDIENEDRPTVRGQMAKNSGYTGRSVLQRLYKLNAFDVGRDLVFDMMHNIPMNVGKKILEKFVEQGAVNGNDIDERLDKVQWNYDFKSGRCPTGFSSRLNRWKAEELQKFLFPLSEIMIGDLLDDKQFHLLQLVSRITEMVYNFRDGWTRDMLKLFENIVKRFVILSEEWIGKDFCVITTHNLLHVSEDIKRFGLPDNYWCWYFERCVKKYIARSSNMKNIEKSFLLAECRREVLKTEDKFVYTYGNQTHINIEEVSATSLRYAKHLKETLNPIPSSVLVGAMRSNFRLLPREDFNLISNLITPVVKDNYFHCFRSLYIDKLYRLDEYALYEKDGELYLVKLALITNIPLDQEFHVVICDLFEKISHDPYSGYSIFSAVSETRIAIPVTLILRKVMVWETMNNDYLAIDYDRKVLPLTSSDILVPLYVENGDMVLVECQDGLHHALVVTINYISNAVQIYYFEKNINDDKQLVKSRYPRDTVNVDSIKDICVGRLHNNGKQFELV